MSLMVNRMCKNRAMLHTVIQEVRLTEATPPLLWQTLATPHLLWQTQATPPLHPFD